MKKQLYEQWEQLKNSQGADTPLVRWGVLLSVLMIAQMWIIDPYLEWRQQQQDLIQTHQRKIGTLIALQNSVEKWRQALQESESHIQQNEQAFISASSYALAQQKMYNLVHDQINLNQLKIDSQRLEEAKNIQLGEQIELQLNLSGKMFDIINFIDAISQAPQLFNFDQLYIAQNQEDAMLRIRLSTYRLQTVNGQSRQPAADTPAGNLEEITQ